MQKEYYTISQIQLIDAMNSDMVKEPHRIVVYFRALKINGGIMGVIPNNGSYTVILCDAPEIGVGEAVQPFMLLCK